MGVCKGIAQWRDYPEDTIRLIAILTAVFTAVAPCFIIYVILGLILPVNPDEAYAPEGGGRRSRRRARREGAGNTYYYTPEPGDIVEDENRRKESDWDNRFSNSDR